jgi:hypothetical protein
MNQRASVLPLSLYMMVRVLIGDWVRLIEMTQVGSQKCTGVENHVAWKKKIMNFYLHLNIQLA